MNNLKSLPSRIAQAMRDNLFELACRVLLPISTTCKVCNMLRGAAIGFVCGGAVIGLLSLPFVGGR